MNEQHDPTQPPTPAKDKLDTTTPGWERSVLEKLALATVNEQRASRRWGIFFKLATLAVVLFALWHLFELGGADMETLGKHTALIEIDGEIGEEGTGAADVVIPALNKAYGDAGSVGIILAINSPGGSPVQAGLINDEMVRLRKLYPNKPLYVVVDEICASGGYYIAAGADRIYVNKASVVGSIGVLMEGFGFTELMKKLGVERRLLTAGENKAILDPYSPQNEKQKAYAQAMLDEIHQQFIAVVRAGRGKRLKETPETFSGLFWTGSKAVEMGLADGYGSVDSVARDVLKSEEVIDYTQREGLPERVLRKFGASVGEGMARFTMSQGKPTLR